MNYYAKVIDVIANIKNAEDIIFEIAKKHPKYVYEAHLRVNGKTKREKILFHYLEGHSKFECVQLCGLLTGKEVNECKALVEMILPLVVIKEKNKK